jgi:hypothetical protein
MENNQSMAEWDRGGGPAVAFWLGRRLTIVV